MVQTKVQSAKSFAFNILLKWRIKLNFEHNTVEVDPRVAKLILKNLI